MKFIITNKNKEYSVNNEDEMKSIISSEYSVQPFQISLSYNKDLNKTYINLSSKLGELFACVGEIIN